MKRFTSSSQQLKQDPKYNSKLVSKFINCLMLDGKKSTAQQVFYDAMDLIGKKIKDSQALDVFEKAINNVKPLIEVRSKRVGGARHQARISAARLQDKIGRTIDVLIDAVDADGPIGRSASDAPEIDGVVYIDDAPGLKPGDKVRVVVTDADEHDLYADLAP